MPSENFNNPQALEINKLTVREFANFLLSLPEELQGRTFSCSGYPVFYLHNRPQEGCVTADTDAFID